MAIKITIGNLTKEDAKLLLEAVKNGKFADIGVTDINIVQEDEEDYIPCPECHLIYCKCDYDPNN